jgi:hypothetical protein
MHKLKLASLAVLAACALATAPAFAAQPYHAGHMKTNWFEEKQSAPQIFIKAGGGGGDVFSFKQEAVTGAFATASSYKTAVTLKNHISQKPGQFQPGGQYVAGALAVTIPLLGISTTSTSVSAS